MRNDRDWPARSPRFAAWIGGALLMVLATAPLEAQRPEEKGTEAPWRGWLGISWRADVDEPGERVIIADGDTVVRLNVDSIAVFADGMHRHLRALLRDSLGPQLREMEREFPRLQRELRELEREMPRLIGPGGFAFGLGARAVAGAEFAEVNEGLSDYFGTRHGALVLRVAPGSPAERAGLQAGDVVVEAGGRTVESVRDLRRAVQAARQDRDVEVEVVRKGRRQELRMRWEE